MLVENGLFAFTTRFPAMLKVGAPDYEHQTEGAFEIFSHAPGCIEMLLERYTFTRLKLQKCFVGDDLFLLWIVRGK